MELEIVIDADGKVTTKVKNGCGRSCRDATKAIREALGTTTEDTALPEFYAPAKDSAKTRAK
jgi:hypothetical protein